MAQIKGGIQSASAGLMATTASHAKQLADTWGIESDEEGGNGSRQKRKQARDHGANRPTHGLESDETPILLEDAPLETADVYLPGNPSAESPLSLTQSDPSAISAQSRAIALGADSTADSRSLGIRSESEAPSAPAGSQQPFVSESSPGDSISPPGSVRSSSGVPLVSRRVASGASLALGPNSPPVDASTGELLVARLPASELESAKAPAAVVAMAQEELVAALADEHRAASLLELEGKDSAVAPVPPQVLRAWVSDGGISPEEQAYLARRDREVLPATRLRHDVLRASGWDVVTVPAEQWRGISAERRRHLLVMLLHRHVRQPRGET